MSTYFEEFGDTYHEENGYLIPDLNAPETPQIDAWGRRYLRYLKTAKRALYTQLVFSGKLAAHLEETERCANEMTDRLMSQMAAHMAVTITSGLYGVLNERKPQDVVGNERAGAEAPALCCFGQVVD